MLRLLDSNDAIIPTCVIIGSSSARTKPHQVIEEMFSMMEITSIYLHEKTIGYYDYESNHAKDDFLPIAHQMSQAERIVLATPVYWYSMSAQLKTFFDRLTDLITTHKSLGRSLAGKSVYVVAWGHEETLPEGFEIPFKRTADYFTMQYKECFYYCTNDKADVERRKQTILDFQQRMLGRHSI